MDSFNIFNKILEQTLKIGYNAIMSKQLAHNVVGDYVERELNIIPVMRLFAYINHRKKGGKYGISSSSFVSRTVSHGSPSAVPSSLAALLMFCTNPGYITGIGFVPCGKCLACKIAKKKEWSDRLIIESHYHEHNYFVTLTYAPEHYPEDESLDPEVLKKFIKRLGYYCGKVPQYFACGEYGDEDYTERAHYHLAIFSDKDIFNEILQSWDFGNVDIKPLVPERCKYICGYVVKKMNKLGDPRLDGRYPEFFSNSRRPALGYAFLYEFLDKFATDESFRQQMLTHAYPPYSIRIAGRNISLPRYIRDKLRGIYEINKELQILKKSEKRSRDTAVASKIYENLSRMYMSNFGDVDGKSFFDKFILPDYKKKLYKERESVNKKAYDKKHKGKL